MNLPTLKPKSQRHHWWPVCVSREWADQDGCTNWLQPDGSLKRMPPHNLGVIGNGHYIKLGKDGKPDPWDENFEDVFSTADSAFPGLIRRLKALNPSNDTPRQRFIPQNISDEEATTITECVVSLAIRGPMNREACVALAEKFRGPLPEPERNALIGLNMRRSQRLVADAIKARAKFVAFYSREKEFIYGDGFFHNISASVNPPMAPKILAPITPHLTLLVWRPAAYVPEPRLSTIVLTSDEVDAFNEAVQIYSKNRIYFRSQQPVLSPEFQAEGHRHYSDTNNPIDRLLKSIPGANPRGLFM